MIDIKTKENLATDEWWVKIGAVKVSGNTSAQAIPQGATQSQGEETVQTWQQVAVLDVGEHAPEFYVGFLVGEHTQFMRVPIKTQHGKFGMRIGDGEVVFYVLPIDLKIAMELTLVEVVDIHDDRYVDLPVY